MDAMSAPYFIVFGDVTTVMDFCDLFIDVAWKNLAEVYYWLKSSHQPCETFSKNSSFACRINNTEHRTKIFYIFLKSICFLAIFKGLSEFYELNLLEMKYFS